MTDLKKGGGWIQTKSTHCSSPTNHKKKSSKNTQESWGGWNSDDGSKIERFQVYILVSLPFTLSFQESIGPKLKTRTISNFVQNNRVPVTVPENPLREGSLEVGRPGNWNCLPKITLTNEHKGRLTRSRDRRKMTQGKRGTSPG